MDSPKGFGFGAELLVTAFIHLKDLKTADVYIQQNVSFLLQVREFMKDLADVEKEYAKRLEAVVKKHNVRRESESVKRNAAIYSTVAGGPTKTRNISPMGFGSLSGGSGSGKVQSEQVEESTVTKAWQSVLSQTENIARSRNQLSESLLNKVAEPLRIMSARKDEARKRHLSHATSLMKERDAVYKEKDASRLKFNENSDTVQSSKQKHDKASEDKAKEKLKRAWHQDILDMNNAKNAYLLNIHAANEVKHKYFSQDMPGVLQDMCLFAENVTQGLQSCLLDFSSVQHNANVTYQIFLDQLQQDIGLISGEVDVKDFLEKTKIGAIHELEPDNFKFLPSGLWKETDQLVIDEHSKIYLHNLLVRLIQESQVLEKEIESKQMGIAGMAKLRDAYAQNKEVGDYDEVSEREINILRTHLTTTSTKVDLIQKTIGPLARDAKFHVFKSTSFAIPTSCDFCQQSIWGVSKAGMTCKECGYNAHLRCEMKIAPSCTGLKGVIRPRLSFSQAPVTTEAKPQLPNQTSDATLFTRNKSSPVNSSNASIYEDAPQYKRGKALYAYMPRPGSQDEVSMAEGEEVIIIEPDDGSGWTVVGTRTGSGVVPTSYIEMVRSREISLVKKEQTAVVLYDYQKRGVEDLTVSSGQKVQVIQDDVDDSGWTGVKVDGKQGILPTSYLQLHFD